MKRSIIVFTLLVAIAATGVAQENLTQLTNTLKERLSISGYAQAGYNYEHAEEESNSFDIKRAILIIKGDITANWSALFMYNFSGSKVLEFYSNYRVCDALNTQFGQFKTPLSIENPMSPTQLEVIDGGSQAVRYLAAVSPSDKLYGGHAGRDLGFMLHGNLLKNLVSYKLALMNGQGINVKDKNNNKDLVANLTLHPTNWLALSGSFSKGKGHAIATSPYNPEIAVGDNYRRDRWAAGFDLHSSPFSLRAEFLQGKDGYVTSKGGYLTTVCNVVPKLDLIASFDYFNYNTTMNEIQTNYVAGIQYWFYPKCRLQAQYTYQYKHLHDNANLIQAQVQVAF